MSDTADIYRMARQSTQNGKNKRLFAARQALKDPETGRLSAPWEEKTMHWWSRDLHGDRLDYWPSTGKWRWRGETNKGTLKAFQKFIAQVTA